MTQEEQVLQLLVAGKNDRDIVRELGIPKSTVGGIRRRNGIKAVGRHLFTLQVVNGKAVCSKCEQERNEGDFVERPRRSRGLIREPHCKFCEYRRTEERLSGSLEAYMKHKASTLKSAAKKRGLPYDLSWQYLVALHNFQNGCCFYTDEPFQRVRGQGHSKQSLSVDKVAPELGYTKANTVLCTYKANVVKNDLTLDEIRRWLPGWYDRIEKRRGSQCWSQISSTSTS
jgi:hypothetical protein